MARLKEKIAYALGDAAAGGIVWKVMSIAFPLFYITLAKKRHKAEIIFVKYKHLKQVFLFQVVSAIEI